MSNNTSSNNTSNNKINNTSNSQRNSDNNLAWKQQQQQQQQQQPSQTQAIQLEGKTTRITFDVPVMKTTRHFNSTTSSSDNPPKNKSSRNTKTINQVSIFPETQQTTEAPQNIHRRGRRKQFDDYYYSGIHHQQDKEHLNNDSLEDNLNIPSHSTLNSQFQKTKLRRFAVPNTQTLVHDKQQEFQDKQLQFSQSLSHLDNFNDNDTISLGSPFHPLQSSCNYSNNQVQEHLHHSLPTILPSYAVSVNNTIRVSHKHQRKTPNAVTLEEHLSSDEWKRREQLVEDWRSIIQQGRRRSIHAEKNVQHDHNHETVLTTLSISKNISGSQSVVIVPSGEDWERAQQSRQMMQVRTALLMKKRETEQRLQRTKESLQYSDAVKMAFSTMKMQG